MLNCHTANRQPLRWGSGAAAVALRTNETLWLLGPTQTGAATRSCIFAFAVLALVAACGRVTCCDLIQAPRPTNHVTPALNESLLSLGLEYPLGPLTALINGELPKSDGNWGVWTFEDGYKYHYQIERGDLALEMRDSTLLISAPLQYAVEACATITDRQICAPLTKVGCGNADDNDWVSGRVSLRAYLRVDPAGRLSTTTSITGVHSDPCNLTILNIPIQGIVVNHLTSKLSEKLPQIDEQIASKTSFKETLDSAWVGLRRPIAIGGRAWLEVQPESLSATAILGDNGAFRFSLGVSASPRAVIDQPPSLPAAATPLLKRDPPTFALRLSNEISFRRMTQEVKRSLVGRVIPLPRPVLRLGPIRIRLPQQSITITDASLSGVGRVAILQVRFVGAARATVYLLGEPRYDEKERALVVDNLDYSVETKNLAVKLIDRLNRAGFLAKIQDATVFNVEDQMEAARILLMQGLNRDLGGRAELRVTIDNMIPEGIFTTDSTFVTSAILRGRARIVPK